MQRLSNFTLKDVTTGRSLSSTAFRAGRRSCSSSWATDCPVGNLYVPRLIELNREFRSKGVVFLGINSNAHETAEEVAKYVKERGIDFPVLKDPENQVTDTALVERTCEVIVLDGFARIRYRGRDRRPVRPGQGQGQAGPQLPARRARGPRLDNEPIKVPATKVAGCLLDRVASSRSTQANSRGSARRRPRSPGGSTAATTSIRSRWARSPMPPTSPRSSRTSASRATGPARSGRSRC